MLQRLSRMAGVLVTVTALVAVGCGDDGGGGGDQQTGDTGGNVDNDTTGGSDVADTGGNPGDDSVNGDDSETPDEDTGSTPSEICDNEVDDDNNGLVDCADTVCKTKPACIEKCDDGVDNDKNGLIDCEDPACEDACQPETCNDWYVCLIEQGCDCDVDVNCPEDQGQCLQVCAQNDTCNGFCTNELSPQFAQYLGDWLTCLSEKCANATGDAFTECYITNCTEEFAYCFYGGTEECSYFYFDCAPQCQTDACVSDCVSALSPEGFLDANEWDTCRGDLCDANEDDQNDSDACYFLSSFYACIDSANGCVPAEVLGGEGTCADAAGCVAACASLGDGECVTACLQFVGAENATAVSDLFQCTIATCGTTEAELVPACLEAAWKNECAAEATTCGISESTPEICDDTTDNDGDGDVDCDDADCAEFAGCAPATEVCDDTTDNDGDGDIDCADSDCAEFAACKPAKVYMYIIIEDTLTECTPAVDTGAPGADIDAIALKSDAAAKGNAVAATWMGTGICTTNDNGDATKAQGANDDAFVSLNGGMLVLTLGEGISVEGGDTITVYESTADMAEDYNVWISVDADGTDKMQVGSGNGMADIKVAAF